MTFDSNIMMLCIWILSVLGVFAPYFIFVGWLEKKEREEQERIKYLYVNIPAFLKEQAD